MMYLLTQRNGQNCHDGCYSLDQARVILYGKFVLENRIYGVDNARQYRKDHGINDEKITDQNIELWANYYGFSCHRIDSSGWAEIAELLDQKNKEDKNKRRINVQIYERVSSF